MEQIDRIHIAFKKLKAAVFFDKTQLPLRDRLVRFEDAQIESKLKHLAAALFDGSEWDQWESEILDAIGALVFPKSLKSINDNTAIFNSDSIPITMEKPQYFIDLPVEGHILGTLWVLEFGAKLDNNAAEELNGYEGMYEHSYGNRLKKNLINPQTGNYTFAPGLFQPYFSQYQVWRDTALKYAEERLDHKQDAMILTLDFKSFYYSVDINQPWFDRFPQQFSMTELWQERLNSFVFHVIQRYSKILHEIHNDNKGLSLKGRNVLPIGFLPSNILSNVILTSFDNAIIERWNPTYYGRYVDDVIIVDKVETNSEIYQKARAKKSGERLNTADILEKFLVNSGIMYRDNSPEDEVTDKNDSEKADKEPTDAEPAHCYCICNEILNCGKSKVAVQDQKVKLFYFQSGSTKALLSSFCSRIKENVSEFRMLPDLDAVLKYKDYSELFDLKNEDSINKLRSVTGIALDKFSLAKFLGKYRKVGSMIESKEEDVFADDALMIFDERTLIENYTVWERLFEIFVVNHKLEIVKKLALRILSAINRYEVPEVNGKTQDLSRISLLRTLHSALCRTLALVWDKDAKKVIESISSQDNTTVQQAKPTLHNSDSDPLYIFEISELNATRRAYCKTRMINKYVLPVAVDFLLDSMRYEDEDNFNLCSFSHVLPRISTDWLNKVSQYCFYPYIFRPQELSFALISADIADASDLTNPKDLTDQVKKHFLQLNYPLADPDNPVCTLDPIISGRIDSISETQHKRDHFATFIGNSKANGSQTLRVAIGNALLKEEDIRNALDAKPNRSYRRYSALRKMIDEAIHEHVDMLVLPEGYIPYEWIPTLASVCANNQLALISGVEHVPVPASDKHEQRGTVYNLTVVILPYRRDDYNFSHVTFHNKVEYSPKEVELISGYRYAPHKGKTYQLFCWRDVWFPVYCCYELCSIHDRSIFQTYADLVIAVEWNHDVRYFGNIVESLVRDMHCYCIQANTSDYGDSRVMIPAKEEKRDRIKTKGGKNSCILWDEIDIKALRDFQVKSLEQQRKDGPFKQTPPDFDQELLEKKRNGTLQSMIL